MARRISKHATRISLITDAGTKHVDTYPTGGVAYGSLSMTNVSNALIRKIKNEDVHGTRYGDEARLGVIGGGIERRGSLARVKTMRSESC